MNRKRALLAAGVAAFVLLATAVVQPGVRAAELPDAVAAGWQGAKTCQILHEDAKIRVLRCTFPPKTGHERHFHPAAFSYVLSGGRFQVSDARGTWQWQSETDQFRANSPEPGHEVLNIGDTTLRYLIVEKKY